MIAVSVCRILVLETAIHVPLHWLTGGVWTLQAPGRVRACVWLMLIPNDDPPPLSSEQRHCACVWTMLESCEQHDGEGVDEFPVM